MPKTFTDMRETMDKFYSDPKMGIGKPKTYNVKTQKFDEDAPTNSAGAGNEEEKQKHSLTE